jgi:uncharacterized membrane protein
MVGTSMARVEAFSDGVFAIAITLLILEIRVPHLDAEAANGPLFAALLALWPSYLAFALSFFVILIMWVNHHELFHLVHAVDYPFLFANGLLLLMVTFVPFPTAVLAHFLGGAAANTAAAFYCATFVLINIAYNVLFRAATHERRLVRPEIGDAVLARVRRAYALALAVYVVAVALALWHALAGLALSASLWLLWVRQLYATERRPGVGE